MKNSFIVVGLITLLAIGTSAEARTVSQSELTATNHEVGHATRDAVDESNYTTTRHHRHRHHHRHHRRHR